jgi:hypothetical protein
MENCPFEEFNSSKDFSICLSRSFIFESVWNLLEGGGKEEKGDEGENGTCRGEDSGVELKSKGGRRKEEQRRTRKREGVDSQQVRCVERRNDHRADSLAIKASESVLHCHH